MCKENRENSLAASETLNKLISLRRAFDKPVLSMVEGLTTSGINNLPFVLISSKDLFSVSLARRG